VVLINSPYIHLFSHLQNLLSRSNHQQQQRTTAAVGGGRSKKQLETYSATNTTLTTKMALLPNDSTNIPSNTMNSEDEEDDSILMTSENMTSDNDSAVSSNDNNNDIEHENVNNISINSNNEEEPTSAQDESRTACLLLEDPAVRSMIDQITNGTVDLVEPPMPKMPKIDPNSKVTTTLKVIQKFINAFEYNHTGQTFFKMKRDRGMKHLTNVAKQIIRDALPIQCVEGVFLGTYLTSDLKTVTRIPVSFKSSVEGE